MKTRSVIIAMLAVASYRVYHRFYPYEPCEADPPIPLAFDLGGSIKEFSWDACHVFSLEYTDARHKFRQASRKAKAQVASLPIVMDDGTDDSPLTMDMAILKGELPGVLIHSSATHGVEGYSGSAIQLALLQEGVLPLPEERPTVVLVHAVNPNGMKNYRRFNENNVDLNRNGISNFEEFLKNRDPNIAGYDNFRDFTAPQNKPTAWWDATVGFWYRAVPLLLQHGYVALKRVLVAGQYHHPQGIFYGGTKREQSIEQLIAFATDPKREILAPIGKKEPVVWIDVHTGLGPSGMDTIVSEKPLMPDEMEKWFPTAYNRLTPEVKSTGAMDGYELVQGPLPSFVFEASHNTALPMTQEFGTLPGVLVARALILENMMYHYGDEEGRRTLGRRWMQGAFYPQSTAWRASIVQRGVSLALESIEYIKANRPEPAAATTEE